MDVFITVLFITITITITGFLITGPCAQLSTQPLLREVSDSAHIEHQLAGSHSDQAGLTASMKTDFLTARLA